MPTSKHTKTILQVLPGLQTGGAEKTTLDIGKAITDHGWNSIVASSGGRMVEELVLNGSRHAEMPLASKNPLTIWRNAARFTRLIRDVEVDLIHARSRGPAWSALIAARRTGIPYVSTYHGAYGQKNIFKKWYNSVMARANRIIANSEWTAKLVRKRNPEAINRIVTVHRGTDFSDFSQKAISVNRRASLRSSWGVNKENFIVVHLARLTRLKGQIFVIEAAAQLQGEFPNLRFVLAGDTKGREEYTNRLKAIIAARKLESVVFMPGHCDDPAAAMAVADCVVMPSIEPETFGRAAVEACGLERPLIVTRIGAVEETVLAVPEVQESERTGWKVSPENATEIAETLREIINLTPKKRAAIGKRARYHCKTNFSLDQMCQKTLAVYEDCFSNDL